MQAFPRTFFYVTIVIFLFLTSPACAPRKTKSTVDRVYELDPSGKLYIHPQLAVNPPLSLAVLPFHSLVGEGRAQGSQILLLSLRGKEEAAAEDVAHLLRMTFFGQLSQLPFELIHPTRVDMRLRKIGVMSWDSLKALTLEQMRDLLGVEAVIFGEVISLDYYYALLYSQVAAGLRLEMISTATGETLWRFHDIRRGHTIRIALDPVSLAVGLFQTAFALRPINMTRAIDEICREAVAHLPSPEVPYEGLPSESD